MRCYLVVLLNSGLGGTCLTVLLIVVSDRLDGESIQQIQHPIKPADPAGNPADPEELGTIWQQTTAEIQQMQAIAADLQGADVCKEASSNTAISCPNTTCHRSAVSR